MPFPSDGLLETENTALILGLGHEHNDSATSNTRPIYRSHCIGFDQRKWLIINI